MATQKPKTKAIRKARRKILQPTKHVCIVKAKCIRCKKTREFRDDEPRPKGWSPMCSDCFMPMIAVKVTLREEPVT